MHQNVVRKTASIKPEQEPVQQPKMRWKPRYGVRVREPNSGDVSTGVSAETWETNSRGVENFGKSGMVPAGRIELPIQF